MIEHVKDEAMTGIDWGVYHTLGRLCIVGRKASGS